jgi:exopolysaccharide biosynthesis polyprenyl glycosylphosphotransferase
MTVAVPAKSGSPRPRVVPAFRAPSPRVRLQLQGPRNVRRHLMRLVVRLVVLVLADLATFVLMRAVVGATRDAGLLGASVAGLLRDLVPKGTLGGGQFAAALLLSLLVTGNYGQGDARRDARQLLLGCSLAAAFSLWARIWTLGIIHVLPIFAAATILVWAAVLGERLGVDKLLRMLGLRPRPLRALFLGNAEECTTVAGGEAFRGASDHQVLGFVSSNGPQPGALGQLGDLHRVLFEQKAESLVICGHLADGDFRRVIDAAHDAGCELLAIPRPLDVTGVEPQLVWRGGQPLIELTSPAFKGEEQVLKRLLDLAVSAVGVVVLSPVLLLVAAAIRLDSPGPAFYRSRRWGRFGREIYIWKFRTMIDGAASLLAQDDALRSQFEENIKLVDDPRITRVGRWLRRTSMDELPQLFNVLLGDMSLVGPRPKLIGEEERYGVAMDTVLAVRPGLTGLWQVSGRNWTTYEERMTLDIKYATHASLWLDFEILLRTIPVVLRGTGAH